MSNIQTGAERMPHDLSHLGFLAGQIGRLITISTTPVIAGDSFEMDAVGALRLSPLRRGLAIDSTVDIFTFYVPHRHVYGEQWISSAVLDLTEDDFDFLTSNKVWIATDRSRARRCVEACVYGTLDFVGYPRFPAPVEFIAAVI